MSVLEEQKSHLWRLSDFLCTYRFWVIANFVISIYGLKFLFYSQISALKQSNNIPIESIGIMLSMMYTGGWLGIIIALIISRSKSIYSLCFLSVTSIVCLYLTQINQHFLVWFGCYTLLSMLSTASFLLAAGYIAQAAKKPFTFITVFGLIYAGMNAMPYSLNLASQYLPYGELTLNIIISLVIATILLLFSHKRIFYVPPKRANRANDDKPITPIWTWADLFSSYRFWGLVLFLMLATFGSYHMNASVQFYYRSELDIDYNYMDSMLRIIAMFTGLVAIPIACIAYLYRRHWSLLVLGLLLIIALFLTTLLNINILFFAVFLYNVTYLALLLVILASIAKAINSVSSFVIAYSTLFIFTQIVRFVSSNLIYSFFDVYSFHQFRYLLPNFYHLLRNISPINLIGGILIFFIIIGLICLSFVNRNLFDTPPQKRQEPNSASEHFSVIAAFILSCLPLFSLFWYANVHGQIKHYSQSPKLLSPTGAVLCILFIPFASLFIFSSLYDVTNEAADKPEKAGWGFMLLSLISPPIAAAIIQYRLNTLYIKTLDTNI